ncbi:MAG: hypothetical protein NZM10_05300 [Fimbriimonadales bacterium]|nr:hypothetical protein [Fimbriimonadales bacterium]
MESTKRNLGIILVLGVILAAVALFLRYRAEQPPPPSAPGYYEGPMLPKSQRMGPPGGGMPAAPQAAPAAPQAAPTAPSGK